MFTKLFRRSKKKPAPISTFDKLKETLDMLERKEKVLQKKIAIEVEIAKEYARTKNRKAAVQCLKKKKLYEAQVEQLGNFQLRIHDQMIMLENAKATNETIDALKSGASTMKAFQKTMSIYDVDKTMDDINEQTENMKQIQESLCMPVGAVADIDEDDLEAELEEIEGAELEEELLKPATIIHAPTSINTSNTSTTTATTTNESLTPPVSVFTEPSRPPPPPPSQRGTEDEELAALQAEMAL